MTPTAERPKYATTVNCCDAWFTGISTCHCCACCQTFTTQSASDKHRTGGHADDTRHCLDPATARFPKGAKREGELIFTDAGRSYPCWATSSTNDRWVEASA